MRASRAIAPGPWLGLPPPVDRPLPSRLARSSRAPTWRIGAATAGQWAGKYFEGRLLRTTTDMEKIVRTRKRLRPYHSAGQAA